MSVSVFEDDLLASMFGDELVSQLFSTSSTIANYICIEIALTNALRDADIISTDAADAIVAGCNSFHPDLSALRSAVAIDGIALPAFVLQLREHIGLPHSEFVHFGATSQDIIDTTLTLSLRDLNAEFSNKFKVLVESIDDLNQQFGTESLMGRTRMQAALPISVKDRLQTWAEPLSRLGEKLKVQAVETAVLQFGGAVGTRHAFGTKGDFIAGHMAKSLGLRNPPNVWHSQRDVLVSYANWLSSVTGGLGKMGRDVCLMAQQGIDEISFSTAGGSSTMPHKQNPVLAETLVTLAQFNATQLSGMHHALVHEQERSGAAWALEWMILPQMCVATVSALNNAHALIQSIDGIGKA
ncbi:MAG: 3-carboxy-cis,cis-muconate cycloisomerase [Hyphomicrobiales bacterium]